MLQLYPSLMVDLEQSQRTVKRDEKNEKSKEEWKLSNQQHY